MIPVFGDDPGSSTGSVGWTAGDASIVYVSTDPQGDEELDVNVVDVNGTNDTHLAAASDAVVSPDGTRVAYITDPTPDQPSGQHVMTIPTRGGKAIGVDVPPDFVLEGVTWSSDGKRLLLSSVDGVVSVAVAPGPAPVVYAAGQSPYPGVGLDLEWTWSEVTWQPVRGPSR